MKDSIYSIESKSVQDDGCCYRIGLDAGHAVYRVHFPQHPVTPGVCLLEIGVELLADALGRDLELSKACGVKFLRTLRPEDSPAKVRIHNVEDGEDLVKAQVEVSTSAAIIARMSLICRTAAK